MSAASMPEAKPYEVLAFNSPVQLEPVLPTTTTREPNLACVRACVACVACVARVRACVRVHACVRVLCECARACVACVRAWVRALHACMRCVRACVRACVV